MMPSFKSIGAHVRLLPRRARVRGLISSSRVAGSTLEQGHSRRTLLQRTVNLQAEPTNRRPRRWFFRALISRAKWPS